MRLGLVLGIALLALAGCGDDVGGAFGTPTDCATVGTVAVTRDREGDVTAGGSGATDLVAVRVAEGPRRTCVAFDAAGDIAGPNAYSIELREGPGQAQIGVVVLSGQEPTVVLRTDDDPVGTPVRDAVAGGEDGTLTVTVPNAALRDAGVGAGFSWRAQTLSGTGQEGESTAPADCVPDC